MHPGLGAALVIPCSFQRAGVPKQGSLCITHLHASMEERLTSAVSKCCASEDSWPISRDIISPQDVCEVLQQGAKACPPAKMDTCRQAQPSPAAATRS